MKKATKIVVAVFALIIGGGIMYSIIKTHSGDKVPTYNKSSTDTQKLELLQQLYHKAPDFNHIAIGAYEDGFSGGICFETAMFLMKKITNKRIFILCREVRMGYRCVSI